MMVVNVDLLSSVCSDMMDVRLIFSFVLLALVASLTILLISVDLLTSLVASLTIRIKLVPGLSVTRDKKNGKKHTAVLRNTSILAI